MANDSETDDSKDRVISRYYHGIHRNTLKRGDHIYAYRGWGVYSHHGIYIGKNKSGVHIVIHFTGNPGKMKSKSTAKIRRASLDEFLDRRPLRLVTYNSIELCAVSHKLESLTKTEVLQSAEYFAENPDEWDDYDLLTNSCGHFCIHCKTGLTVYDIINSNIQDQAKDPLVKMVAVARKSILAITS